MKPLDPDSPDLKCLEKTDSVGTIFLNSSVASVKAKPVPDYQERKSP